MCFRLAVRLWYDLNNGKKNIRFDTRNVRSLYMSDSLTAAKNGYSENGIGGGAWTGSSWLRIRAVGGHL
jgi:hypothetical protein